MKNREVRRIKDNVLEMTARFGRVPLHLLDMGSVGSGR